MFTQRNGDWRRVLDGTAAAPPGGEGAPAAILDPSGGEFAVGQRLDVVELVDFRSDGTPELVVAVANAGASGGPLQVWILSLGEAGFRTDYYTETARGGRLEVEGDEVTLELGVYRPRDPGCCPSRVERRTIGFDPATGEIGVVARERVRT